LERRTAKRTVHDRAVYTHGTHDETARHSRYRAGVGQNVVRRVACELRRRGGGRIGDVLVFTRAPIPCIAISGTSVVLELKRTRDMPASRAKVGAARNSGKVVPTVAPFGLPVLQLADNTLQVGFEN